MAHGASQFLIDDREKHAAARAAGVREVWARNCPPPPPGDECGEAVRAVVVCPNVRRAEVLGAIEDYSRAAWLRGDHRRDA